MKRFLPSTLFGQTLLTLLAGIGLSLLAGAWIYSSARQEAVRTVGAIGLAERIVNLARLVDEVPVDWRDRIVHGSNDAGFRVSIVQARPPSPIRELATYPARVLEDYVKEALPGRDVIVSAVRLGHSPPDGGRGPGTGEPMHKGRMHGGWASASGPPGRGGMSWRTLDAAIGLEDGRWLKIATSLPDTGPTISPRLLLALGVMAAMIAAVSAWVVRRMTAPLSLLSEAARQIGHNVATPPLAVKGSIELQQAAGAFNDMQGRLRKLIDNRTLMLAAISHDLRTQLTLLRLRTEAVEHPENRERMLATIGDMEEMLTATLTFARDETASELGRRIDISALLESIVDDMSDAGLKVTAGAIAEKLEVTCKPAALRRAVVNLIDNALKYGTSARVSLERRTGAIAITIEDEGPGIPPEEIARVLQPFYRVEASRNRDTGGIGLGLAITSAIAEAQGGRLVLENRAEGGLRATLLLPLERNPAPK
jgi:signal transduction histidine kinase